MDKNKIIRWYLWLGIVFAVVLGFLERSFLLNLPNFEAGNYGDMTVSIFQLEFVNYFDQVSVLNTPLIGFIGFLVLSILVAVYALKDQRVKQKQIQDVLIYNVVIVLMLIIASIVYMIMIPERVNGSIEHKFFVSLFEIQRDNFVTVYNFVYTLLLAYILLNLEMLRETKEKVFKEKKQVEELDSEFL
jgi:hypothetical protein